MPRFSLSLVLVALSFGTLGTLGTLACSSSGTATPAGGDSGPAPDAGTTDGGADSSSTPDTSVPTGKGLIISNATVASLDGSYDIQVTRFANAGGLAFNGNFDGKTRSRSTPTRAASSRPRTSGTTRARG